MRGSLAPAPHHVQVGSTERLPAFDAVELLAFDTEEGVSVVNAANGQATVALAGSMQARSIRVVEGLDGGAPLSPGSAIHGTPGSIVEYDWPDLSSGGGVVIGESFEKIPPICADPDFNCDDFTGGGVPPGNGLVIEEWRDGAWTIIGDLVPPMSWERVAIQLPEGPADALRLRVRWEGTHHFRMIGWAPEASEIEPSYRLQPREAEHSRSGGLGSALAAVDGIPALLTPGDVISLAFDAPPVDEGKQHLALRFDGRYSLSLNGLGSAAGVAGIGRPSFVPGVTAVTISGSNPFNPETTWNLDVAQAAPVDLRIYDARGRLIRKLVSDRLEAGRHIARWDGRDEEGRAVPSGVYFWRFNGAGLRRAEKFVVLK